jgi:protein tyrosine/serine phosphatase
MKNHGFIVIQALLLMTFAACQSARAENKPAVAQNTPKIVKTAEDLPNFHQIHPFLYRSGEPTEAGLQKLRAMGVSTIIDLRAPSEQHFDEQALAGKLGLKYMRLVMSSRPPTAKQVETMLATIKKAKAAPEAGSVLVHCAHGSDRTGCMIGIWRVSQDGWNYEAAYKEMRKYWFTPKFTALAAAVRQRAENR